MDDSARACLSRLTAVEPALTRIAPLRALAPDLPPDTLLHAGPPFETAAEAPVPVLNGAVAAAMLEGWAGDAAEAMAALAAGRIRLSPAQDAGVVTPLAFVVGPSSPCLEVRDAAGAGPTRIAPMNDGPAPDALRFGTGRAAGLAMLRALGDMVPSFAAALRTPAPLLPFMAAALNEGDDLHGRLTAAQKRVPALFTGALDAAAAAWLERANQFALNVVMAAAATMLGAAAGTVGGRLVVACGGNGRRFGWKLAGEPDRWIVAPARRPEGPRFAGFETARALPAIGDSAVIDALGLGAACLRFAPDQAAALGDGLDPVWLTPEAHAPFLGPHPALADGVRVGLDLARPRCVLGVMLGLVEETGTHGLIGRGVAPWPTA